MMRRAPRWFTEGKAKERLHKWWPWGVGAISAVLYGINPEPFDEIAATAVTKLRRPLLRGLEWMDVHDVDPETLALELPPDMIFGPLEFSQQMKFLIAALKADNELADGYLARVFVDHMDLSLDPPLLTQEAFLAAGGRELLEFAVRDFLDQRAPRRHKFFHPDTFLHMVNLVAPYPKLSEWFVREADGVRLVLAALRHSKDDYARVLAMRSLTVFAFTQREDADVERRLMQCNGLRLIVDSYRQSSGDPTDTRYLTVLLSALLRHFPTVAGREFLEADGVRAAVSNLNIARYKGIPQHLRVLHDALALPPAAFAAAGAPPNKPAKAKSGDDDALGLHDAPTEAERARLGPPSATRALYEAELLPVALGIIDAFPEYYEVATDLLDLLRVMAPHATPLEFLEFRMLPILNKFFVRHRDFEPLRSDGTLQQITALVRMVLDDPQCQKCFDKRVATYDLLSTLEKTRLLLEEAQQLAALQASSLSLSPPVAVAAA